MKILKSSKSKGFTLIELLVVISIISLLSSVVLASLKSAKQRADNAKVVAEMKSLQVALELYRNQFGNYPGFFKDETPEASPQLNQYQGFNDFIKNELVTRKFLSKVVQSKNYPNNCIGNDCMNGNFFYYQPSGPGWSQYCGGIKANGYILGYITLEKLNLPRATTDGYLPGEIFSNYMYSDPTMLNDYCISG